FVLPLPPGHRFPMAKYRRLRERLTQERVVPEGWMRVPDGVSDTDLQRAHLPAYVRAVAEGRLSAAEQRRIGFPWSPGMVERSRRSAGATLAACRAALAHGTGVNLAGGTHHAFAGRGEGYCVFNDAAVAVRVLQAEGAVGRVLVVDTDVHQGNGTAALFRGDDSVFTLDLYGERNFPFEKEPCDLGRPLPDGTGDARYLEVLDTALADAQSRSEPDLVVYVSGADPYEGDRLGRLALSKAGLAERDRVVFAACRRAGLPVAVTMAGGYAADIEDTVDIHVATVREALTAGI
ncbi:MAG: histone deacetylase, partial [Synechococcaceae cyanobacterium]|nr:histone deacetylase [Synechococcaceae cyanobacterium]